MKRKVYSKTTKLIFVREVTPAGTYRYVVKLRCWLSHSDLMQMYQVLPKSQWRGQSVVFDKYADANRVFLMLALAL